MSGISGRGMCTNVVHVVFIKCVERVIGLSGRKREGKCRNVSRAASTANSCKTVVN